MILSIAKQLIKSERAAVPSCDSDINIQLLCKKAFGLNTDMTRTSIHLPVGRASHQADLWSWYLSVAV